MLFKRERVEELIDLWFYWFEAYPEHPDGADVIETIQKALKHRDSIRLVFENGNRREERSEVTLQKDDGPEVLRQKICEQMKAGFGVLMQVDDFTSAMKREEYRVRYEEEQRLEDQYLRANPYIPRTNAKWEKKLIESPWFEEVNALIANGVPCEAARQQVGVRIERVRLGYVL